MSLKDAADAARAAEEASNRLESLKAEKQDLQDKLETIRARIVAESTSVQKATEKLKAAVAGIA